MSVQRLSLSPLIHVVIFSFTYLFSFCFITTNAISADALFFKIDYPESLQYVFEFLPSYHIGGRFPDRQLNRYMYYADPPEACSPLNNADDIEDQVVLIERGGCTFTDKAIQAQLAGAKMAIITDSRNGSEGFIDMIRDDTNRIASIPVGFLPGSNGKRMRDFLTYEDEYIRLVIPLNLTTRGLRDVINKPPWELW